MIQPPNTDNVHAFYVQQSSDRREFEPITNPQEAVQKEELGPEPGFPARMRLTARFQAFWYQYTHRWDFRSDGVVEVKAGLAGRLRPQQRSEGGAHQSDLEGYEAEWLHHIHNFYARFVFGPGLAERDQSAWVVPAATDTKTSWDTGNLLFVESTIQHEAPEAQKHIRVTAAHGEGYEVVPRSLGWADTEASWGNTSEIDFSVKNLRSERTSFGSVASGWLDDDQKESVARDWGAGGPGSPEFVPESIELGGSGLVVWHVLRKSHEPRMEDRGCTPFHFVGCELRPHRFPAQPAASE